MADGEVDGADGDVGDVGADGLLDCLLRGAAELEETGVRGDKNVEDAFVPAAGAGVAGNLGREDAGPVLGEGVEEGAGVEVEAFEGALDDLREGRGGGVGYRGVGVDGEPGDDGAEEPGDVAVVGLVAGAEGLAFAPALVLVGEVGGLVGGVGEVGLFARVGFCKLWFAFTHGDSVS